MELALALVLVGAVTFSTLADQRKKVVCCGWGMSAATPDVYITHADRFARCGVDGILTSLQSRRPDGTLRVLSKVFETDWKYEDFAQEVPKLGKMTAHPAFRETFLTLYLSPSKRRLDWFDDASWARVAANLRTLARLAREGGCRGIAVDPEDYIKRRQFKRLPTDRPGVDMCRIARRRGAELFREVFTEYPNVTILSFWFLSLTPNWYGSKYGFRDMTAISEGDDSLWPAFLDGMLDVLPRTAKLVDGNEDYWLDADKGAFYKARHWIRHGLRPLVSPENRGKYDSQMQVSSGIYLDMYVNPTNSTWHFPPKNGSRLETLRRNYVQALDAADEYVWLYGEKHQFVEWDDFYPLQKACLRERWEDVLPGINDMIAAEKDPDGFVAARKAVLQANNQWENMVSNGVCAADGVGDVPKPFSVWWSPPPDKKDASAKGSVGTFCTDINFGDGDSSSLCAIGVPDGCFLLSVKGVLPDEYYFVRASSCGDGTSATVSWRDARGRYVGDTCYLKFGEPAGRWRHGGVLVRAPMGATKICLSLGVRLAPGGKAWFDNVGVFCMANVFHSGVRIK